MTTKYLSDINKHNNKSLLKLFTYLKLAPDKKKRKEKKFKGQTSHHRTPEKHDSTPHPVTGTEHHKYSAKL